MYTTLSILFLLLLFSAFSRPFTNGKFTDSETCIFMGAAWTSNHRTIEQAELEMTHQDHQIQLLGLQKTPQESHHVPDSIVQTFF